MTKITRTLSVLVLLLFLVALGFLFFLRHNSQRKKFPEVGVGVRKQPMRRRIDPAPALSLLINREEELELFRGTPMVLTVSIVNHRAMIADAQEKSDRVHVQQLRAAADRGEMPKENVEAQIARMELAPEVGAIHLGSDAVPWDSSLQLSEKLSDGTLRPLSWAARPVQPAAAKHVTLKAKTSAELRFVADPSVAAQIPPGVHQIVAALDVPSTGNAKSGTWTGQSQSEPVALTIQEKPGLLSPADEEKLDLHFVDYFYASGDFTEAAKRAQSALAVNPKSIVAAIALGEAEKAHGDLKGALEAFQKATSEYYRQYPKSYEPPTLLISRISDIEAAIEIEHPPSGSPP
jgi:hypothetical protein